MSFKLGNTNISELYVGSTKIGSAYLGSTLVYQSVAPGPPVPEDGVLIGNVIWSKFYVDYSISGVNPRRTYTYHNKDIAFYAYNDLRSVTFPNNWRLPTSSDYSNLLQTVGDRNGYKLISIEDGGTDDYGMNLYKTGYVTGTYYKTKNATDSAYFMYYGSSYIVNASTYYLGTTTVSTSYKAIPIRLVLNV